MCGRFTVLLSTRAVAPFGVTLGEPLPERYNVAPSRMVPVIRVCDGYERLGRCWQPRVVRLC